MRLFSCSDPGFSYICMETEPPPFFSRLPETQEIPPESRNDDPREGGRPCEINESHRFRRDLFLSCGINEFHRFCGCAQGYPCAHPQNLWNSLIPHDRNRSLRNLWDSLISHGRPPSLGSSFLDSGGISWVSGSREKKGGGSVSIQMYENPGSEQENKRILALSGVGHLLYSTDVK